MTTNQTLVYNSVTPAQALTSAQPRELYDYESDNISTFSGALETKLDYAETRICLRFEAKDAILQAIVEGRFAVAQHSKPDQKKPEEISQLQDGTQVDIWCEPGDKSEPGWRGPADLIKTFARDGK